MAVYTERNSDTERIDTEQGDTDQNVEEAARVLLQHSSYRAIRHLTCRYEAGTLTIQGRVPTYHYKQLAQTVVAELDDVSRVINDVMVGATDSR